MTAQAPLGHGHHIELDIYVYTCYTMCMVHSPTRASKAPGKAASRQRLRIPSELDRHARQLLANELDPDRAYRFYRRHASEVPLPETVPRLRPQREHPARTSQDECAEFTDCKMNVLAVSLTTDGFVSVVHTLRDEGEPRQLYHQRFLDRAGAEDRFLVLLDETVQDEGWQPVPPLLPPLIDVWQRLGRQSRPRRVVDATRVVQQVDVPEQASNAPEPGQGAPAPRQSRPILEPAMATVFARFAERTADEHEIQDKASAAEVWRRRQFGQANRAATGLLKAVGFKGAFLRRRSR